MLRSEQSRQNEVFHSYHRPRRQVPNCPSYRCRKMEKGGNADVVLPYPRTAHPSSKASVAGGEMSLKRLTVAVMVSVCAFAAHATAQKNEVSGLMGRTFIS